MVLLYVRIGIYGGVRVVVMMVMPVVMTMMTVVMSVMPVVMTMTLGHTS